MKKNTLVSLIVLSFALAGNVFAEEAAKTDAKHIQMHEQMAEAHKNAAQCLKDGKSVDVCRAEFKKAMKSAKEDCDCDSAHCPMDGHGKQKKSKRGE